MEQTPIRPDEEQTNPTQPTQPTRPTRPVDETVQAETLPATGEPEPEEEYMTDFMKYVKSRTDRQWDLLQAVCGVVLGCICGVLVMFFSGMESVGTYALVAAAFIALFLPQILVRQGGRAIPKLRIWLIAALSVWLVASLILHLAGGTLFAPIN